MAFVSLVREGKVSDGHRSVHRYQGRVLLLLQVDGRRYLCDARCPHRGVLMSAGRVEKGRLRCPGHGLHFDLETGENIEGLCAPMMRLPLVHAAGQIGFDG